MITINGLNLNLVTSGAGYRIKDGFKLPDLSPAYQVDESGKRPVVLPGAKKRIAELPIPITIYGGGEDEILELYGALGKLQTHIERQSDRGGVTATLDYPLATSDSEIDVVALAVSDVAIDRKHFRSRRATCTVTIWFNPLILGPWETFADGTLPAGMPAWDGSLMNYTTYGSGLEHDLVGPARVRFINQGSTDLKFIAAALDHMENVGANARCWYPASDLDFSTVPLDGAYTAGTNEVQRLTKSGTISGGTWEFAWGGFTFGPFAHNASVASVQSALTGVGFSAITVSGSPLSSGNMSFTFTGKFAGRHLESIDFDGSALTGGGTVTHSTITTGVAGYVSTTLSSDFKPFARTPDFSDDGVFQLWAYVQDQGSAADVVRVRAKWSVGDTSQAKTNISVKVPVTQAPVWVYLGDAHISPHDNGTHSWGFTVEALTVGTVGTEFRVLDVVKQPVRNGRIRVNSVDVDEAATTLSDNVNQSAGAYTGKSMDIGGAVSGGGSATDIQVDATNHRLQRTATGDTADVGRHVYAGGNLSDSRASVLFGRSTGYAAGVFYGGLILRFVDANNFAFLGFKADPGWWTLSIRKKVAGAFTTLEESFLPIGVVSSGMESIELVGEVRSDGLAVVTFGGESIAAHDDVFDSGALASGKCGLYDEYRGGTSWARYYDNFRAFRLPAPNVAISAGRDMYWTDDGRAERESTAGSVYAYTPGQIGAGVPEIGPEGLQPDMITTLLNRLTFIRADQNPEITATSALSPRVDFEIERRRAWMVGRWPA